MIDRLPLEGLRVFETAARHMSFTDAARELSVTQAAVSRRIKSLEGLLGFDLFLRKGRGLVLTPKGRRLFDRVQAALDYLGEELDAITDHEAERQVSIAASASISHLWLSPRLRAFAAIAPQVSVRVLTTDSLDRLASTEHDLTILYSKGQHPDWALTRLVAEELVPVAAPAYLQTDAPVDLAPRDVAELTLLDYQRVNIRWVTLQGWFERQAPALPPPRPAVVYSSYALAVDAALRGDGVVLGSRGMLRPLLDSGQLIEVSRQVLVTGYGYDLGIPRHRPVSEASFMLAKFLIREATGDDEAVEHLGLMG